MTNDDDGRTARSGTNQDLEGSGRACYCNNPDHPNYPEDEDNQMEIANGGYQRQQIGVMLIEPLRLDRTVASCLEAAQTFLLQQQQRQQQDQQEHRLWWNDRDSGGDGSEDIHAHRVRENTSIVGAVICGDHPGSANDDVAAVGHSELPRNGCCFRGLAAPSHAVAGPTINFLHEEQDKEGRLPLHCLLSRQPSVEVVDLFVRGYRESVSHATRKHGWLPIHHACHYGASIDVIKYLTDAHPESLQQPTRSTGLLPIHLVLQQRFGAGLGSDSGAGRRFSSVSSSSATLSSLNSAHINLYHHPSGSEIVDIVRYLLERYPASIQCGTGHGCLPLHVAVDRRRCIPAGTSIMKSLLDLYPEALSLRDSVRGALPIHYAVRRNALPTSVIERMIKLDRTSLYAPDSDGDLPIHCAILQHARYDIIRLLSREAPSTVRYCGSDRRSPLHCAVDGNTSTAIRTVCYLLFQYPQALRQRDVHGRLPLHTAVETVGINANTSVNTGGGVGGSSTRMRLIKMLIDGYPEALGVVDGNGRYPLRLSIIKTAPLDVVKLLVNCSIDRNLFGVPPSPCKPVVATCGDTGGVLERGNSSNNLRGVTNSTTSSPPHSLDRYLCYAIAMKVPLELVSLFMEKCLSASSDGAKTPVVVGGDVLHFAIHCKSSPEIVDLVIRRSPDSIRWYDRCDGLLPLHRALFSNASIDIVRLLIRHYPDSVGQRCRHCWRHACGSPGSTNVVGEKLSVGPFLREGRGFLSSSALKTASSIGLERRDSGDTNGTTVRLSSTSSSCCRGWLLPLHCACQAGASSDVVELLVTSYPEACSAPDHYGRLAIHHALRRRNRLRRRRSCPGSQTGAVASAVEAGTIETLRTLIKHHPDCVLERDSRDRLPFEVAHQHDQSIDTLFFLLRRAPEALSQMRSATPARNRHHYTDIATPSALKRRFSGRWTPHKRHRIQDLGE